MKIFITGGSGFIGTNLVRRLLDRKIQISSIDIKAPRDESLLCVHQFLDILDKDNLIKHVINFEPDVIIHLAARTDLDESRGLDGYTANTVGVENLIEAIHQVKTVKRVLIFSSLLVCRNGYLPNNDEDYCPTTYYGQSKVITEQLVRNDINFPCPWIIIRPTSIWGPWFSSPYRDFFIYVARGLYIHPGHKKVIKALGYIGNTVYQIESLIDQPIEQVQSKTFYLSDYEKISIDDWALEVAKAFGRRRILRLPLPILTFIAFIGDLLKRIGLKNVPMTTFRLTNMLTQSDYNTSELEILTGKLPYTYIHGIQETVKWIKKYKII